jgi:hypothetical protein
MVFVITEQVGSQVFFYMASSRALNGNRHRDWTTIGAHAWPFQTEESARAHLENEFTPQERAESKFGVAELVPDE